MLNRGILIVALAAGLFAGSGVAGFLLATGALRHVPRAASFGGIPGSPAALPSHTSAGGGASGGAATGPAAGSPRASGAAPTTPGGTPPAPNTPDAGTTTVVPGGVRQTGPAPAVPGPAPSAAAPPPAAPAAPPAAGGAVPPRTTGPAAATGRFHVQVADFPERQNADALAVQLRSRGYAVTVTDGPPYRVWVGGYLDRATAERLAAHLRENGLSPTLVPQ